MELVNDLRRTRHGGQSLAAPASRPYQVQATIAALHDRAASAVDTDWAEIELLYRVLEQLQPSPVVILNRAVALSKAQGPVPALALLAPLAESLAGYFHYFGVKEALHRQLGENDAARECFNRAIALAHTPAAAHIREHLEVLA